MNVEGQKRASRRASSHAPKSQRASTAKPCQAARPPSGEPAPRPPRAPGQQQPPGAALCGPGRCQAAQRAQPARYQQRAQAIKLTCDMCNLCFADSAQTTPPACVIQAAESACVRDLSNHAHLHVTLKRRKVGHKVHVNDGAEKEFNVSNHARLHVTQEDT